MLAIGGIAEELSVYYCRKEVEVSFSAPPFLLVEGDLVWILLGKVTEAKLCLEVRIIESSRFLKPCLGFSSFTILILAYGARPPLLGAKNCE